MLTLQATESEVVKTGASVAKGGVHPLAPPFPLFPVPCSLPPTYGYALLKLSGLLN